MGQLTSKSIARLRRSLRTTERAPHSTPPPPRAPRVRRAVAAGGLTPGKTDTAGIASGASGTVFLMDVDPTTGAMTATTDSVSVHNPFPGAVAGSVLVWWTEYAGYKYVVIEACPGA